METRFHSGHFRKLNHRAVAEDCRVQENRETWILSPDGAETDCWAVGQTSMVGGHSLTLTNLFQIVTGCCLFFVCMRWSPVLAIVLTLLTTPATIRTGLVSRRYQEAGLEFHWGRRVWAFCESLMIMWMTMALALVTFVFISLTFGLICILVTSATPSGTDLMRDIGFIGTLGGTIWGGAGAIMSLSVSQRFWVLPPVSQATGD